jgi:hypothetical protein
MTSQREPGFRPVTFAIAPNLRNIPAMKRVLVLAIAAAIVHPAPGQEPQDNWYWDATWTKSESGDGALTTPYGVAVGPDGRIYVGDQGSPVSIVIYNPDGSYSGEITGTFGGGESLSHPRGMITDAAGKLHVADVNRNAVFIFNSDGSFHRKIGGTSGSGDGELSSVRDVGVDDAGEIYVLENGNRRVSVFAPDGTFLRKWGGSGLLAGQLYNPLSLAVSPSGDVYVCQHEYTDSRWETSLKQFDRNGQFVRKLNTFSVIGPGDYNHTVFQGAASLRLDAGGYLHVLSSTFVLWAARPPYVDESPRIRVYNRDLTSVTTYTPTQSGHDGYNDFRFPCHAIGPDGTVFLAQKSKKRLLVFPLALRDQAAIPPNAIPLPNTIAISQRANSPWVDIDYRVTDADDATVHTAMLAFTEGTQSLENCVRTLTLVDGTAAKLGPGQAANQVHRVTWDAGADLVEPLMEYRIAVLAKDSRQGLLDIHYLNLPADRGMPALKISRSPLIQNDFMQVWWWLLATQDPGITLDAGAIVGVGGAYDGTALCNSSGTTNADGRDYIYAKMNVREATADEVQWAKEGSVEGVVNQWDPARTVAGRPKKVNEYGFDTGNWGSSAWWVVPVE